jgi:hypothetical protein
MFVSIRCLALCGLAMMSAGCATQPVKVADARPLPQASLLPGYLALSTPVADGGKVVVVRDKGFTGGGITVDLLVNGAAVGRLSTGDRVEFYLPKGSHVLGTRLHRLFDKPVQEAALIVDTGKTYYFRITLSPSGGVQLNPSTQIQ